MGFDEPLDAFLLFLDVLDGVANTIASLSVVVEGMLVQQQLDLLLQGGDLLPILSKRSGVFLGGVGRQLASIQGELFHPDEIKLSADHEDLHKHLFDVLAFRRNE